MPILTEDGVFSIIKLNTPAYIPKVRLVHRNYMVSELHGLSVVQSWGLGPARAMSETEHQD